MDLNQIPLFQALTRRMAWLTERQTVLADNVANAYTPGYQAKDLKEPDFRTLLQASSSHLAMAATQPDHIEPVAPAVQSEVETPKAERVIDGNSVSLEDQMMKVSQNAADYQLTADLYRANLSLLSTAIGKSGG